MRALLQCVIFRTFDSIAIVQGGLDRGVLHLVKVVLHFEHSLALSDCTGTSDGRRVQ
jgi:hypothetical protein